MEELDNTIFQASSSKKSVVDAQKHVLSRDYIHACFSVWQIVLISKIFRSRKMVILQA